MLTSHPGSAHQRLLFGVDWAPMLPDPQHAEVYIALYLAQLLEDFGHLRMAPSGKAWLENHRFTSLKAVFQGLSSPFEPSERSMGRSPSSSRPTCFSAGRTERQRSPSAGV